MTARVPDWLERGVTPNLPLMLRIPLGGLRDALLRDDHVAAAWLSKDVAETVLKLLHATLAAQAFDLVRSGAPLAGKDRRIVRELARRLAGLAADRPGMGTWLHAVRELSGRDALLGAPHSIAHRLAEALRTPLSEETDSPMRALEALHRWRNEFHGHGALGDAERARDEVARQLDNLRAIVTGLNPVFSSLSLAIDERGRPAAGADPKAVRWSGLNLRPFLEFVRPGELEPTAERPILHYFEAADSRARTVWFRDVVEGRSEVVPRGLLRSPELDGLEMLAGDPLDLERRGGVQRRERRGGARNLAVGWLDHLREIAFSGFGSGLYLEPTHLVREVEALLRGGSRKGGMIRLIGPGGVGKSFLARGLVQKLRGRIGDDARDSRNLVLPVFLLPGDGQRIEWFVQELNWELGRERDRLRERGIMLSVPSGFPGTVPSEFQAWISQLVEANPSLNRVVIVVDGLDEIDASNHDPTVASLLPRDSIGRLFVLASARPESELPPSVTKELDARSWLGTVEIAPGSERTLEFLEEYLAWRSPSLAPPDRRRIVERAGGRFLYVEHYARWLGRWGLAELPAPERFYGAVFDWFRAQTQRVPKYAHALEQTLLVLAAAREPMSREVLIACGIDESLIEEALLDLRDFVARERADDSPVHERAEPFTYRIFHRDIVDFLERDAKWSPRLKEVHATIGTRVTLATGGECPPSIESYAWTHGGAHLRRGDVRHPEVVEAARSMANTASLAAIVLAENFLQAGRARRFGEGAVEAARVACDVLEDARSFEVLAWASYYLVEVAQSLRRADLALAAGHEAAKAGRQAFALRRTNLTRRARAVGHAALAGALWQSDRLAEAEHMYLRALRDERRLERRQSTARSRGTVTNTLARLAELAFVRGDMERAYRRARLAASRAERVLAGTRRPADSAIERVEMALQKVAQIASGLAELDRARTALDRALEWNERRATLHGSSFRQTRGRFVLLEHLVVVALERDEVDVAAKAADEAYALNETLRHEVGEQPELVRDHGRALLHVAEVADARGQWTRARRLFEASASRLRELADSESDDSLQNLLDMAAVEARVYEAELRRGRLPRARRLASRVIKSYNRARARVGETAELKMRLANAYGSRASVAEAQGDSHRCIADLRRALRLHSENAERAEAPQTLAAYRDTLRRLAGVRLDLGQASVARSLARRALEVTKRLTEMCGESSDAALDRAVGEALLATIAHKTNRLRLARRRFRGAVALCASVEPRDAQYVEALERIFIGAAAVERELGDHRTAKRLERRASQLRR